MTSSDPLLELLAPHIQESTSPNTTSDSKGRSSNILNEPIASAYLSRLSSLPLSHILETEHAALQSTSHTLNVSIQALSSRSHKALIASSQHLSTLPASLEILQSSLHSLAAKAPSPKNRHHAPSIPALDAAIQSFVGKFQRDSPALVERSKAHLLSRNLDRLLDILELPTLLSSSISAGNYPTALDILSHVRRLVILYPESRSVKEVARECEDLQKTMITNLVGGLRGAIKLPTAMKTVGWLKRVVPEMAEDEDIARALFLVCRLAWVEGLFSALEPLRELADEETESRRKRGTRSNNDTGNGRIGRGSSTGQHTERYLKRWIEIFREQSFAVVSMYRSIFPSKRATESMPPLTNTLFVPHRSSSAYSSAATSPVPYSMQQKESRDNNDHDPYDDDIDIDRAPPAPPLSTFTLHLLKLLETTLGTYLPNIQDKSARESLLTQVLYAAGSLGRLGGDFSGLVGCLGGCEEVALIDGRGTQDEEDGGREAEIEQGERESGIVKGEEVHEWVEVMRKHKILASRLEALAAGGAAAGAGVR